MLFNLMNLSQLEQTTMAKGKQFLFAQFFFEFYKSDNIRKLKAWGRLCKTLNHFLITVLQLNSD